VSETKFGPHRVVCRIPLTNIRITTFFAGEHEVRASIRLARSCSPPSVVK
jgi:hypothetical protein